MLTVSPIVSPNVVARILIIQNPSVTAGTLVIASFIFWFMEILLRQSPRIQIRTHRAIAHKQEFK